MALDEMCLHSSTRLLDHCDQVGMRVSFPRMITHVSHVTDGHIPPARLRSPSSILGLTSVSHLDKNGGHTGGYGCDVMGIDLVGTGRYACDGRLSFCAAGCSPFAISRVQEDP